MSNFLKSPILRMSFSLMMLTTCILLTSNFLGFVPDVNKSQIQSRKIVVEMLATQIASGLIPNHVDTVQGLFTTLVHRNENVVSAALRDGSKKFVTKYGDHEKYWLPNDKGISTSTHLQVPIYSNGSRLGVLEVSFKKLHESMFHVGSLFSLLIFVALSGFMSYSLFLRRAMIELDPGAVIPERVNNALNTLSEGLIIIGEDERVLFSNDFLMKRLSLTVDNVVGKKASDLGWVRKENDDECFPWLSLLAGGSEIQDAEIKYQTALGEQIVFKVKSSQIRGADTQIRGVIITFNDITELEVKNKELQRTLAQLKQGQQEIARQNNELKILSTRDPLTGCLNRRSFFEELDALIAEAEVDNLPLSCVMLDIDHFKAVNDNYGHSVGDQVIKMVVDKLMQVTRPTDLVGRYGGEEFCVILPGSVAAKAMAVAESMRLAVLSASTVTSSGELKITASFGVACLVGQLVEASQFVDRADQALYDAKENGRNLVRLWSADSFSTIDEEGGLSTGVASFGENVRGIDVTDNFDVQAVELVSIAMFDNEMINEPENNVADLEKKSAESIPDQGALHYLEGRGYGTTALPSRLIMFDRIAQAIERACRYKGTVAILVLDIEGVKRITNSMGSSTADKFAQSLIQEIKGALRNTDSLGFFDTNRMPFSLSQINGDELAVLLTDIEHADVLVGVVSRIFKVLESPSIIDGSELYLDSSIGISLFPEDGTEPDKLIGSASCAMHEAKRVAGRNNFRFSSSEIQTQANKRFLIQNALHGAVERGEFVVHYQPKVDTFSGIMVGMEALVRWQSPELGFVNPDEFITIAENIGLIGDVTKSVLSIVCSQLCAWRAAGIPLVPVAVNLSPVEFRNKNLAVDIIEMINVSGLSAQDIEFEITENVVINGEDDMESAAMIVRQFSEAGISMSLDDFGTGYCSYNYLKKFPVQALKIDRCFITNFTEDKCGAAIVNSMISIGKNLDLKIVAEGVESKAQLRLLRDLQCDQIQGYLISKPVTSDEATTLLTDPSIIRNRVMVCMADSAQPLLVMNHSGAAELIGVLNNIR
jgi:diguanylate cyclase (GGDEF)-like protein/PAS domain S-box-containing protein